MRKRIGFIILLCFILSYRVATADNHTLRIGYWDKFSEASQCILEKYPTLNIISGSITANTTDEIINQFLTKEFSFDVFPIFSIQYDVRPLIKKGYLSDLSDNEMLHDSITKMRPDIVSLVSKGSGIYALPYGLETEFLSIQPEAWKKAGFNTDEIPDTFDAFLDFLDIWSKAPVPGYCVINQFDETMYTENSYSKWLLELLFDNYLMQYRYAGKPITFNDLSLKHMMEHCITTGKALYQAEKTPNLGYALFESSCSGIAAKDIVSLRMDISQPKLVKAYMWLVAVNADSSEQDLAMEYAMHVLNENTTISYLLFQIPSSVINPYYTQTLEEYNNIINETVDRLSNDNLSADSKLKLQNDLDEYRDTLKEYMDEKNMYYVTDVQIREFYDHVDGIYIETPGPLSVGSEYGPFLNQLIASYAAGLSSTDQMINKLNEICWMIQMEENL